MPLTNTPSSYGGVTKFFHWTTALLILTAFPVGYFANQLAHQIQSPTFDGSAETISQATLLFSIHKTIGVTAFFTAFLRILWAMTQSKPGLLHPDNKPEALLAEVIHWMLYGAMLITPLSGWIHHAATTGFAPIWWPFGQSLPFVAKSETVSTIFSQIHWLSVWTLFAALGLHIAGALKHHVIDRDSTLRRMLPGSYSLPTPPAQTHSFVPAVVALIVWGAILTTGTFLGSGGTVSAVTTTAPAIDTADASTEPPAAQGNWQVTEGTLGLTIQQMGSAVQGSFSTWSADIQFEEPTTPGPAGRVTVEIDIASLKLGTVTDQAMGPDYFDTATYPTAKFEAEIEKLSEGYQAVGTLTIRDKIQPLSLPFDLQLDGDKAEMQGRVTVNRMDYDVGLGTKDEGSLGFTVDITVTLKATKT